MLVTKRDLRDYVKYLEDLTGRELIIDWDSNRPRVWYSKDGLIQRSLSPSELRYEGKCRDCGAALEVGSKAKWYGRGKVYGIGCHANTGKEKTAYQRGDRSRGAFMSHYDRHGIYSHDGKKLGSSCGCIDYPCCGH
jgi:hypothetical protein